MAVAKTSAFTLTAMVQLPTTATNVTETIDLGAYVDAGDSQGVAIESVDFIWQSYTTATDAVNYSIVTTNTDDWSGMVQLTNNDTDSVLIPANDGRLIASGTIHCDSAHIVSTGDDIYPDRFGKGDSAYYVIGDTLYLTGVAGGIRTSGRGAQVIARIRCRVVKLAVKDWQAIALQASAQDN